MQFFRLPAALLSLAGRHGTLLAAASIFIGLAVPPLSAAIKPWLGEAIIVMLTLAFLRVDPVELRRHISRPGLVAASCVWVMIVTPAVLCTLFLSLGIKQSLPGLYFMLVLQMSAPGLMSSPAIAALLGLDVALTLASLIVSIAITPITASLFTHFFLGAALISPLALGVRLFLIIAGCAAAAAIIRRIAGKAFIERATRAHRRHERDRHVVLRHRRHGRRGRSFHRKTRCWWSRSPRSPSRSRSACLSSPPWSSCAPAARAPSPSG